MTSTETSSGEFGGNGNGNGVTMGKQKKIIFLTSSEYGQANVILAVAYEMLLLQQHQIHIASFSPLKGRIKSLNESIPDNHIPATFHTVFGPSALEALVAKNEFIGPYPPGLRGALDTYRITLPVLATAWDGPAYMKGYESCLEILRSVEPDLIIIEPLCSQGLEACNTLSRDCVVLSPNTFQEMCGSQQPKFYQLCRYPAISSAFPFPVPWYLVPANIYLKTILLWILVTSPTVKTFLNYRKSQGLPGLPAAFDIYHKENHYLVPAIPETDYPCKIPSNVTGCGPILLPVSPVSKDDPNLQSWLVRGPTVLINLGTHLRMDDTMARQFASGLKITLDKNPNLQILWKLKTSGGLAMPSKLKSGSGFQGEGLNKESLDAISAEVLSDRVRIVEWMSVDPLAVLQTGHIVCSVHHGGSNSFHEALSAGVPQVVLPCWLDTLEFANRVEWLGIGVYGSRSATPSVEGQELSQALMKVLGDGIEAARMKQKARELADISGKVGGRKKALEKILEILESS